MVRTDQILDIFFSMLERFIDGLSVEYKKKRKSLG